MIASRCRFSNYLAYFGSNYLAHLGFARDLLSAARASKQRGCLPEGCSRSIPAPASVPNSVVRSVPPSVTNDTLALQHKLCTVQAAPPGQQYPTALFDRVAIRVTAMSANTYSFRKGPPVSKLIFASFVILSAGLSHSIQFPRVGGANPIS